MLINKAKKLGLDDPNEQNFRIKQAKNSQIRFLQLIVENKKMDDVENSLENFQFGKKN